MYSLFVAQTYTTSSKRARERARESERERAREGERERERDTHLESTPPTETPPTCDDLVP